MNSPTMLFGIKDIHGELHIIAVHIEDEIIHEIFNGHSYMATSDFHSLAEVCAALNS